VGRVRLAGASLIGVVAVAVGLFMVATRPRGAAAPQKPDLSVKTLVALATKYVADYQRQFTFVVADERYRQQNDLPNKAPWVRVARGEMFLTYLEADRAWTVVHDITEVDDKPVANHESVRSLLQMSNTTVQSVARKIFDLNARYNIGGIRRNFNDPMIAMQVFHDRYRDNIQFDLVRSETRDDATLATLRFREKDRPTIVVGTDGTAFPAKGEILMDAVSGAIRHTHFTIENKGLGADLDTNLAYEERLALWVPVLFTERYWAKLGRSGTEVTTCSSEYSNYRRFEVKGRIKDGTEGTGRTGGTGGAAAR
jgi:hypothetical protein